MLNRISNKRNVQLVETDKELDAKCDGLIIKDNKLIGVFESKCRNMTISKLESFGSWLVTYEKILCGQSISKMLRIGFFGFLYLIPDDVITMWHITNNKGEFRYHFDIKETETQRTINGGKALRENAFLPVSECIWI